MSKIIAMTGATGFAGGHAVRELLNRRMQVRALVRDPARAKLPVGVEPVAGGLHDAGALDRLLRGASVVVHLAGAISAVNEHEFFRVNAHGTVALAEAARRHGVGRFVHVSSLAAREPKLSPYGASKRAGEDAVAALMEPLNAVILRPPAVYGPGDRATLPLFRELTRPVALVPGRAANRFSLLHVEDLARLIADAAESNLRGIEEIDDGAAGGYGWNQLLEIAGRERGAAIRTVFLPRPLMEAAALGAGLWSRATSRPAIISRGKIAELYHPDWVARGAALKLARPVVFAEGFPRTLAWYRREGWLPLNPRPDRSGAQTNKDAGP